VRCLPVPAEHLLSAVAGGVLEAMIGVDDRGKSGSSASETTVPQEPSTPSMASENPRTGTASPESSASSVGVAVPLHGRGNPSPCPRWGGCGRAAEAGELGRRGASGFGGDDKGSPTVTVAGPNDFNR
jgi:hypothetical protein